MTNVRTSAVTLTLGPDDLRRSRLTSFFRPILVIPHWIVLIVLSFVGSFVMVAGWVCALFIARLPLWAHAYLARLLSYSAQVSAYMYLAVDQYPPFFAPVGSSDWIVSVQLPEPRKQRRWGIFFRYLLMYPVILVIAFTGYGALFISMGAWWAILFTGRIPRGVRNQLLNSIRISANFSVYGYVLTSQYPNIDPLQGLVGGDQPAVEAPAAPAEIVA